MKKRLPLISLILLSMSALIVFAVISGVMLLDDTQSETEEAFVEVYERSAPVYDADIEVVELDVSAPALASLDYRPTPTPQPTPTPAPTPTPEPAPESEKDPGCVLENASTVSLTAAFSEVPVSDEGMLYVYQLAPYEYDINGTGARKVAETRAGIKPSVEFALTAREIPGLYCKYVFVSSNDGQLSMLGEPQYITNPEKAASGTHGQISYPASKKDMAGIFTNWDVQRKGFARPIMQICNYGENPVLRHPLANVADSHPAYNAGESIMQYMLNASNADGVNALVAVMREVASMPGTQAYIVGNEVNVRKWCYISYCGDQQYIREYMQGFRVAYNAIKSVNADAQVFICLDQCWDRNMTNQEMYQFIDGKDFIDEFNRLICAGGNINWSLAFHPHTVPLDYSAFWNVGTARDPIYASEVASCHMVTFQNMGAITSYMQNASLLYNGQVRTMIASEVGISRYPDEASQRAALVASYKLCQMNGMVKLMEYSQDFVFEYPPSVMDVFNNLGTGSAQEAEYERQAMETIGISDWSQVRIR